GVCAVQLFPGSLAPGAPRALFVFSQLTAGLVVRPAQLAGAAPFPTAFRRYLNRCRCGEIAAGPQPENGGAVGRITYAASCITA
ncbi:hypothetical protein, partial [Nocardia carnea]|uniref:hypothetical protein n=1 Tax=Nocardia carnea TaxID=37328 RepID=UPI0024574668